MALTKSQEQAVIRLFALAFKSCNNIEEQKKMYLQFENEFGKGINDWKEKCRNALQEQSSDEEIIEAYNVLATRNNKNNLEEKYLIRPLERKDLGQVRELMNTSLNTHLYENEQIEKFLKTKYSFVAYANDEILGVLLADSIIKMFVDELWIDVLAVAEGVREQGIGKKLFQHLRSIAVSEKKNVIRLYTERNRDSYHIYKHWGFKESDGAQMECFCFR